MISPEQFVRQFNNKETQKSVQLAKIDPDYTSGLPSVIYDIDILSGTKSKPLPHLSSYQPVANDRVMVMNGVVIGKIGDFDGTGGGDYAPINHNHDDRYYTETELNNIGIQTNSPFISDFNNAINTGFFHGSNTTLNAPVLGAGDHGFKHLQVIRYGLFWVQQICWDFGNNSIWTRSSTDVATTRVWTPWKKTMTKGDYGIGGESINITGNDMNVITEGGFYRGYLNTNQPPRVAGDHDWKYYQIIQHDPNWIIQLAWDFNHVAHHTRIRQNGIWQPWVRRW